MLCSKVSTSLTGARVPTLPKRVQSTRVQKSGAVCVAASPVPADGVDSFDSIVDGLVSGLRTGAGLVKSAVPIVQVMNACTSYTKLNGVWGHIRFN